MFFSPFLIFRPNRDGPTWKPLRGRVITAGTEEESNHYLLTVYKCSSSFSVYFSFFPPSPGEKGVVSDVPGSWLPEAHWIMATNPLVVPSPCRLLATLVPECRLAHPRGDNGGSFSISIRSLHGHRWVTPPLHLAWHCNSSTFHTVSTTEGFTVFLKFLSECASLLTLLGLHLAAADENEDDYDDQAGLLAISGKDFWQC